MLQIVSSACIYVWRREHFPLTLFFQLKQHYLAFSVSPYIIKNSIAIQKGATLTIDPGVDMRFDFFHKLYCGSFWQREPLLIASPLHQIVQTRSHWTGIEYLLKILALIVANPILALR